MLLNMLSTVWYSEAFSEFRTNATEYGMDATEFMIGSQDVGHPLTFTENRNCPKKRNKYAPPF